MKIEVKLLSVGGTSLFGINALFLHIRTHKPYFESSKLFQNTRAKITTKTNFALLFLYYNLALHLSIRSKPKFL